MISKFVKIAKWMLFVSWLTCGGQRRSRDLSNAAIDSTSNSPSISEVTFLVGFHGSRAWR